MKKISTLEKQTVCSIVIVNYNTRELLLDCLNSIYINCGQKYSYEIYVVDNASTDRSVEAVKERYPDVIVLPLNENLGFAKANNLALKCIESNYILLLNPDTIVTENALEILLDFIQEQPKAGAVGCKIVMPDGKLDKACKRGFPTPGNSFWYLTGISKLFPKVKMFGGYQLSYLDENEINEVDSLVGAFMLIRKQALDEVGLIDEDFFMYGEDIDLCYRMKKSGWKIIYNPEAVIIHYKGAGSLINYGSAKKVSKKRSYKVIHDFHRAMIIFYQKHYKAQYHMLVRGMIYFGIGIKFAFEVTKNIFRK